MSASLTMSLDEGWTLEVETDELIYSLVEYPDPYEELDEVYRKAKLKLDSHFRGTS